MQKLLVGLILALTAAVGALWVSHSSLSEDIDAKLQRRTSGPSRGTASEEVHAAQLRALETRLKNLGAEVSKLRAENSDLVGAFDRLRRARPVSTKSKDPNATGAEGDPRLALPGRDNEGDYAFTQEDEEYFMALQKRVERRRRLEGMTRNLMRRIDRLVRNNEMTAMGDGVREKVESAIRVYVESNDDLVTVFVREPSADVKSLSPEERRNRLNDEREKINNETQRVLAGVIGSDSAALVVERTVARTSSVRRGIGRRNR